MEGQLGNCSEGESGEYLAQMDQGTELHWYSVLNETPRESTKKLPPRPLHQVIITSIQGI